MFNERHAILSVWESCSSAAWTKNDHNAPYLIKQAAGSFTAVWMFQTILAQMVLLLTMTVLLALEACSKVWPALSNNSLKHYFLW